MIGDWDEQYRHSMEILTEACDEYLTHSMEIQWQHSIDAIFITISIRCHGIKLIK
jgi:hypothetical protein